MWETFQEASLQSQWLQFITGLGKIECYSIIAFLRLAVELIKSTGFLCGNIRIQNLKVFNEV